jgi:hypothetical protein
LLFVGCCCLEPKVPQGEKQHIPVFDTQAFKQASDINYSYWIDSTGDRTLVLMEPSDLYKNMDDVIVLKGNYNLLLNNLNKFNEEVKKTEKEPLK